jgi:monooxygenase
MEEVDVLIVGAGLSGIGAAYHIKTECPGKSWAIVEGRAALGGTWDLFKYPGIRSDSDMHTLGFRFKPWKHEKAIADAPSILEYLHETADENDIAPRIRYNMRVIAADWNSEVARWTVTLETGGEKKQISAGFLFMCTGYYNYSEGYRPEFPDEAKFNGPIIHPQFWPENLDYQGKRVVVIGSGATAVTLVPAMADAGAGHVTMLQRSPSYIVTRPAKDALGNRLRKYLPGKLAYGLTRWKNIAGGMLLFNLSQKRPEKMKTRIMEMASAELGPDFDVNTHLNPSYKPWDQRMCLIPDSDMFRVMREGQADIVTDTIDRFTENGIRLNSGKELAADIIISATGLKMEVMSGVALSVDGAPRKLGETLSYKGFMYSGLPNLASSFGYSNASWTLKADLISEYVCRLLNHMDQAKQDWCMPEATGVETTDTSLLTLTSGYVQRALDRLPKQGTRKPWRAYHNYVADLMLLRHGKLNDGAMTFGKKRGLSVAKHAPAEEKLLEAA